MRIISGTYKGRRLTAPKNLPVRPTTDFAKEALFNILRVRYYFDELTVLDLFSGTGNISFEFASRGVPNITSVDAHQGCIQYINKISEEFSFPITTVKSEVSKYLDTSSGKYDVIFADPPYDFDVSQLDTIVNTVFDKSFLAEEGLLIIEHSKMNSLSDNKYFVEARKYGGNVFSFFSNIKNGT
ncbi:RsmD family RNA methyltransferase [Aequorivita lipolytica]|uniref:Methyltransferase domain-containing protein n=1 Tax=Aequorivita lipolytica TaxID=153267 RepID=A0A5C6YQR0_9FLAO|nr:RsmD family RNA methyltransferase [Aequorivita lipolytica]TXD69174.1 methyltransferase domain-containing protein [Aequorivita lipolytica]SRX51243.1 Ribosomal RNA small subunit methyltransferase D [Aequorivita lipolytica]